MDNNWTITENRKKLQPTFVPKDCLWTANRLKKMWSFYWKIA